MEDRETLRMRKYGESKTTRIMMATVPHVTSGSGLRKFRADGFLLDRVYSRHCSPPITAAVFVLVCYGRPDIYVCLEIRTQDEVTV